MEMKRRGLVLSLRFVVLYRLITAAVVCRNLSCMCE